MKQGHWNRWIIWRWPVPLFILIIGRFHAQAPKFLKNLSNALLLSLLLAAVLLAVPLAPAQAQEEGWIILYQENFNDEKAQGWDLDEGWVVKGGILVGSDYDWAYYPEGNWGDAQINFQLAYLENYLNSYVRFSGTGFYNIKLQIGGSVEFPRLYIYLSKQTGLVPISLLSDEMLIGKWDPNTQVEITIIGGNIQVKINNEYGDMVLEYTDTEPLPSGTIAFESSPFVVVDDIVVRGPPLMPPPPPQEPFIIAVDPPQGNCGSEVQLRILGANFQPNVSVFIPEGIETLYTEFKSPKELRAGVFIAEDAPPGERTVIVTSTTLFEATLEGGFTVICPSPEMPGQPDLNIIQIDWGIAEEGHLLLIAAQVRNAGVDQALETTLYAESQTNRQWSAEAVVPKLPGGSSAEVIIESVIPDELRGITHLFRVSVDPRNEIVESNEDNNWREIEVPVPPPTTETPPSRWPRWPPFAGGAVVILVGTLAARQAIKNRGRQKWQEKAEEEPPEPCEPGTTCCHKVESKCELAQCQVKHLTLLVHDAVSGKPVKEKQLKDEIVDGLDRIIAASRRGETSENLKEQVTPLARRLLQLILEWLHPETAPRDVSVIVHLEGCKITYKFSLKRCQETGTWGEAENEWEVTIKEERDEPLAILPSLEPGAGILEQLTAELARQLMQLIEKV